jgi:hypothetical protein
MNLYVHEFPRILLLQSRAREIRAGAKQEFSFCEKKMAIKIGADRRIHCLGTALASVRKINGKQLKLLSKKFTAPNR